LSSTRAKAFIVIHSLASLLVIFIALPVFSLFARIEPPALREVLGGTLLAEQVRSAFRVTIEASLLAVTVLLLTGIPLAYILARCSFPGKRVVETLVDLPFVMPHAVAGIMLLTAYGRSGVASPLLDKLGTRLEDSFAGVVAVMVFVSAPLLVDTVRTGIESIDPMTEAVARSLEATQLRVLLTITLPMSLRHIVAGALLAWARAISEVGALLIVAYHPKTVNVLIIELLNAYGLGYAVAVSALLAAFAIAVFIALRTVTGK
jgi:molybdate/tungstate transport system permease protein